MGTVLDMIPGTPKESANIQSRTQVHTRLLLEFWLEERR